MAIKKVAKQSQKIETTKSTKSMKSTKKQEVSQDGNHVNGSTVILKDVEIQFWAYKKISSNPKYDPKFAVTVKLSDKHLELLEAAKESAIQYYCSTEEEDLDPEDVEFVDSIYENKDGEFTYTFRSDKDFREDTDVDGEQCDPDVKIGRGSIANIAVRARVCKIFKAYNVTFYMNAANITSLVEYSGGNFDLRAALR